MATLIDKAAVLARIDELLEIKPTIQNYTAVAEVQQGTLTLAQLVYGLNSHAALTILESAKTAPARKDGTIANNYVHDVWPAAKGVLAAMRKEVEAGLVGDLRRRGVGETLADMLTLAKEAVSDGALNVAAVLAAAAFEDTFRRMESTLAAVYDRRPLSEVLIALKQAILDGAPFTIAQALPEVPQRFASCRLEQDRRCDHIECDCIRPRANSPALRLKRSLSGRWLRGKSRNKK